jgi:hypothetical protein
MKAVIRFRYHDKNRLAFVGELRPEKGGLVCWQIKPERGVRTYKPEKMQHVKQFGYWRTLYYNLVESRA